MENIKFSDLKYLITSFFFFLISESTPNVITEYERIFGLCVNT